MASSGRWTDDENVATADTGTESTTEAAPPPAGVTGGGALAEDTQNQAIAAGPATKFVITSAAITAGAATTTANLGPFTVQRQDALGNPATPAGAATVTLGSTSTGTTFFSTTPGGAAGTATTTVTIPADASSASFYYADTQPGSWTITASGALASGTQGVGIVAGPADKLVVTSGSIAGAASDTAIRGPIVVQVRDVADNPVTTGASVLLSSTDPATAVFSASSSGTAVSSLTIPAGSSSATFHYGNTTAGTATVTASAAGLTGATLAGAITPAAQSQLVFGQQPTNTDKGDTITPAVTARVLDRFGNLTTSAATISIEIANNGGAGLLGLGAGTLHGDLTKSAVGGVTTFSDLEIRGGVLGIGGQGPGYTLRVSSSTSPAVTPMVSAPFDIT